IRMEIAVVNITKIATSKERSILSSAGQRQFSKIVRFSPKKEEDMLLQLRLKKLPNSALYSSIANSQAMVNQPPFIWEDLGETMRKLFSSTQKWEPTSNPKVGTIGVNQMLKKLLSTLNLVPKVQGQMPLNGCTGLIN